MAAREIVEELRARPVGLTRAFVKRVFDVMVERFDRNNILTYASAMAVQLLTAVIPLALLAFLLVGAFGKESYWRNQIAPKLSGRVAAPVYQAVDHIAEGLINTLHVHWLVFAVLLMLWEVSGAVRTVMGALNSIYEHEETRPIWHRFGLSFGLAAGVAVATLGALLLTLRGGALLSLGPAQPVWTAARWLIVLVLLWAVVAMLVRFAPDGEQSAGWVTAGSVLIVVSWVVATLVFGWYVTSAANYRTPFGSAVAALTLVGYMYTSSIIFLVGAQIDRLLQEQAEREDGPLDGVL